MRDQLSNLPNPACGGAEHTLHRRKFLQGAGAGALSLMSWGGLFSLPAFAQQAKRAQNHCILLWLCGAPSQFETWDPKPGRPTGGPFRSIPTKLPGVHFGELMPKCAGIADRLAVVRSMKTTQSEHLQGSICSAAAPRRARPSCGPRWEPCSPSNSANWTARSRTSSYSTPAPKGTSSRNSRPATGRLAGRAVRARPRRRRIQDRECRPRGGSLRGRP